MSRLQGICRTSRQRAAGTLAAWTLMVVGLSVAGPVHAAAQQSGDGPRVTASAAADVAPEIRRSRIQVAPGVELDVVQAGPQDGEPIVLLHGFTDSWFSWSRLLELLPAGVRAVVPSQRGHGDSDRPACCYELADFAADVVALLDSLGIERAHVVGHSMGGLIAQRVAVTYPDRVDRLVIIGSAAAVDSSAVADFIDIVLKLSDPVDPVFIREFQLSTTALPLPTEFLEGVIRESAKLPARVWRASLGGLVAPQAAHDVSRIQAPTLILWGELDAMFSRAGQDHLLRTIPDARLITYPEAAHSPNWEIPDRVAADLTAFLGSGNVGKHR